jgi:hypothetical protein
MTRGLRDAIIRWAVNRHCGRKVMKLTTYLPIVMIDMLLLLAAAQAQAPAIVQQVGAADKAEEAAKAECKVKADPSILINYWKTAGAAPDNPAALAELENRAKRICVTQGGGNSHSYTLNGNAGPMKVSGTACSLTKAFTVKGSGGGMWIEFSYSPGDENGGSLSYTGGGTGSLAMVRMAGKGTYTVKLNDKGGTLIQTHTGAVTNPGGGSATHTDTLTLTPTGPC